MPAPSVGPLRGRLADHPDAGGATGAKKLIGKRAVHDARVERSQQPVARARRLSLADLLDIEFFHRLNNEFVF